MRALVYHGPVGRLAFSHDRARCVMDHLLAHRTQQQSSEPAPSAGPDDDQVGALRRLEQGMGR